MGGRGIEGMSGREACGYESSRVESSRRSDPAPNEQRVTRSGVLDVATLMGFGGRASAMLGRDLDIDGLGGLAGACPGIL